MDFYQKYELIDPLPGEGTRSFRARQIATGREVAVHLLVGGKTPENEAMLTRLRALPEGSLRKLIEVGDNEGTTVRRHRGAAVSASGGMAGGTGARERARPLAIHARGDLEDTRGAGAPATARPSRAIAGAGRIHTNVPAGRRPRSSAGDAAAGRVYAYVSGIPCAGITAAGADAASGIAGYVRDQDHALSGSTEPACGGEGSGAAVPPGGERVHPHVPDGWRFTPTACRSRATGAGCVTAWGIHAYVRKAARGGAGTGAAWPSAKAQRTRRIHPRFPIAVTQRARPRGLAGAAAPARAARRIHAYV